MSSERKSDAPSQPSADMPVSRPGGMHPSHDYRRGGCVACGLARTSLAADLPCEMADADAPEPSQPRAPDTAPAGMREQLSKWGVPSAIAERILASLGTADTAPDALRADDIEWLREIARKNRASAEHARTIFLSPGFAEGTRREARKNAERHTADAERIDRIAAALAPASAPGTGEPSAALACVCGEDASAHVVPMGNCEGFSPITASRK